MSEPTMQYTKVPFPGVAFERRIALREELAGVLEAEGAPPHDVVSRIRVAIYQYSLEIRRYLKYFIEEALLELRRTDDEPLGQNGLRAVVYSASINPQYFADLLQDGQCAIAEMCEEGTAINANGRPDQWVWDMHYAAH